MMFQEYYMLYRKLAGLTGTGKIQAGLLRKVYDLDVAVVPTRRPVNRVDHKDRIYPDADAKYAAIAEEIRHYSQDLGRPVLVGTRTIDESEKMSELLTRQHGIQHQVLNARPENTVREAGIITAAGQQRPVKKGSKQMVGAVTIATNMAGRGTDITLGPGVVCQGCKVPSEERLAELGADADPIFPPGDTKCCIACPEYDEATQCARCFKAKIDGDFPRRGRTTCRKEPPCGLHVIGAERQWSRRIDNQLCARAGSHGEPGSSRFFLSLDDDLMQTIADELENSGALVVEGGMVIRDKRVSKAIERAQKGREQRILRCVEAAGV